MVDTGATFCVLVTTGGVAFRPLLVGAAGGMVFGVVTLLVTAAVAVSAVFFEAVAVGVHAVFVVTDNWKITLHMMYENIQVQQDGFHSHTHTQEPNATYLYCPLLELNQEWRQYQLAFSNPWQLEEKHTDESSTDSGMG